MKTAAEKAAWGVIGATIIIGLWLIIANAFSADITPGYTFVDRDHVTYGKLNAAATGTVNTAFFTAKSECTNLSAGDLFLVYEDGPAGFRKVRFDGIHTNTAWIPDRSDVTLSTNDYLMVWDTSAGSYGKVTPSAFVTSFTNVAHTETNEVDPTVKVLILNTNGIWETVNLSFLLTNALESIGTNGMGFGSSPVVDKYIAYFDNNEQRWEAMAMGNIFTNWTPNGITNANMLDEIVFWRKTAPSGPRRMTFSDLSSVLNTNWTFTVTNGLSAVSDAIGWTNAHSLGAMPDELICLFVITNSAGWNGWPGGTVLSTDTGFLFDSVDTYPLPMVSASSDSTNVYVHFGDSTYDKHLFRSHTNHNYFQVDGNAMMSNCVLRVTARRFK